MKSLKELWAFLRVRKKFWLLPIMIVVIILGALLIQAQVADVAPIFYNVF
jgi:competence protein ComGC